MAGRRALFGESRRRSSDAPLDIDAIRAAAVAQGWRVERTTKGHLRFVPPEASRRIVITGGTPSDHRAIRNLLADLRREGLRY